MADDELTKLLNNPSLEKRKAAPAKQLRSKMAAIEKQLEDGMSHEEMVELLNSHGYELTLNTFRSILYRYRRKVASGKKVPASDVPPVNANGNLQVDDQEPETSPHSDDNLTGRERLDAALDARQREKIGDKYLGQSRPLFNKRSTKQ